MSASTLPTEIGPEELADLLKSPQPPCVVDCRETDEWHICRIEGAQLVPLTQFAELAPVKLAHAKERPLIVYCHHGMRSMRATLWLRQQGFDQAQSLRGGIDLWSELVDPSVPRY